MYRFNKILSVAVLAFTAFVLAWFFWPALVLLVVWPILAASSAMHDLIEGYERPLALANLALSIAILAAYAYAPRLLWRAIRRPAPRHP